MRQERRWRGCVRTGGGSTTRISETRAYQRRGGFAQRPQAREKRPVRARECRAQGRVTCREPRYDRQVDLRAGGPDLVDNAIAVHQDGDGFSLDAARMSPGRHAAPHRHCAAYPEKTLTTSARRTRGLASAFSPWRALQRSTSAPPAHPRECKDLVVREQGGRCARTTWRICITGSAMKRPPGWPHRPRSWRQGGGRAQRAAPRRGELMPWPFAYPADLSRRARTHWDMGGPPGKVDQESLMMSVQRGRAAGGEEGKCHAGCGHQPDSTAMFKQRLQADGGCQAEGRHRRRSGPVSAPRPGSLPGQEPEQAMTKREPRKPVSSPVTV